MVSCIMSAGCIIMYVTDLIFLEKYYLVDSGYPNRTGYLAPFKGSTLVTVLVARAAQGHHQIRNKAVNKLSRQLISILLKRSHK